MNFTPNPIAFTIPLPFTLFGQTSLPIYWYGILIVLGAVLGALLATREAKRRGVDPDHVWNALLFVLLFGDARVDPRAKNAARRRAKNTETARAGVD